MSRVVPVDRRRERLGEEGFKGKLEFPFMKGGIHQVWRWVRSKVALGTRPEIIGK